MPENPKETGCREAGEDGRPDLLEEGLLEHGCSFQQVHCREPEKIPRGAARALGDLLRRVIFLERLHAQPVLAQRADAFE